jgi:hypothetical protein
MRRCSVSQYIMLRPQFSVPLLVWAHTHQGTNAARVLLLFIPRARGKNEQHHEGCVGVHGGPRNMHAHTDARVMLGP